MSAAGPGFLLYGCGGHGRSVAGIVLDNHPDARLIFVDARARPGETILGFPALPAPPPEAAEYRVLVALGDNAARRDAFLALVRSPTEPLISRHAHLGAGARIGAGTVVATRAFVGPEAVVGVNSILNTGCIVEHEVRVGDHVHLAPHVTVCGRVEIGDGVFLGAGVTVIDKLRIAPGIIVGAGATVVRSLDRPGLYLGTPARWVEPPACLPPG
jgi:sugar O-acyltransferase (sialic acid O-acetyltransferase NeuD family)